MKTRKRKKSEQPVSGSQPEEMYGLATRKNMFLDRPTSHGGWPEGEYDPPVNDRIYDYLRSMGLMNERLLRSYVRNILIESDDAKEATITSEEPSFWREVGKTISRNYDSLPQVNKDEVDAWAAWLDDAAGKLGIVLAGIGLGAAAFSTGVGEVILAASAITGILNSSFQGTLEMQKGNYSAAGGHVANIAMDMALGAGAEKLAKKAGQYVGDAAAESVKDAKKISRARNYGYGPDQTLPPTRDAVRIFRRSQDSISGARSGGQALSAFGVGLIGGVVLEAMGNKMIEIGQRFDEERRAAGLASRPELSRETIEMGRRFASGTQTSSDMMRFGDSMQRLEIVDPSERAALKVVLDPEYMKKLEAEYLDK